MTNLDEDTLNDMNLARKTINESDSSLVVVQFGKIWKEKKEPGVKPLLDIIDEMGEDIHGSVIGTSFLCKSSAMLCRYAKARAVHAPRGTKTGIAILIMGGIPSQIDEMVSKVVGDEDYLLDGVESVDDAYNILKGKII